MIKDIDKLKFSEMAILVGGLGTRLSSVISDVPKPMAPVNSIPFLHYVILYWANQGVKNFYLLSGFKSEIIENYFCNKFNHINVQVEKEEELLGTGGAINSFLKKNKIFNKSEFLAILNGDTWLSINRNKLNKKLSSLSNEVLVVCRKIENNDRYGTLKLKKDKIFDICKPNLAKATINAGLYIGQISLWEEIFSNYKPNQNFSFESRIMPELARNGFLTGTTCVKNFLDIGVPYDYKKTNLLLKKELDRTNYFLS